MISSKNILYNIVMYRNSMKINGPKDKLGIVVRWHWSPLHFRRRVETLVGGQKSRRISKYYQK